MCVTFVNVNRIMQSFKGKAVSPVSNSLIGSSSMSITQAHSSTPRGSTQVEKVKEHHKFRRCGDLHSMFSEPLDSTSSDEMSFDEEDMYGSDPDVETISLVSASNDKELCSDEDVVCVQPTHLMYAILHNDRTMTVCWSWMAYPQQLVIWK